MSFSENFVALFTGMQVLPAIFLVVGLILVTIEIFIPGFGIIGISGSVSILVGIILQAVLGESFNIVQAVILVFLLLVIIIIVFLFMLLLVKLGWISHTILVQNKTAVPTDITDGTLDYAFLVGKTGIAATQLHPIGKAIIDDEEYDVIAFNGMMFEKDTNLIVTKVEGVKIIVKEIKGTKE